MNEKYFFCVKKNCFVDWRKYLWEKNLQLEKKKSFGKILFWWKTEMWVEMNVDRTNSWWFGKRWELCERWVKERKRLRWLDDQRIGEFRLKTREKCTDTVSTMVTATHLLKNRPHGQSRYCICLVTRNFCIYWFRLRKINILIFILRGKFSPDHMMTALRIFLSVYLMFVSYYFFLEIELTTQINFSHLTFVRDNIFPSFKKFLSLTMRILETTCPCRLFFNSCVAVTILWENYA